ncbi:MAG TPA: hypothetical protein VGO54_17495 [Bradyrhizobium sp.]|jgi:hypothetical protein|nr:hypothetical protein [Bradyrhizobium sp.]
MRKPGAAFIAARKPSAPRRSRSDTPIELICAALALALLVLVARIFSVW